MNTEIANDFKVNYSILYRYGIELLNNLLSSNPIHLEDLDPGFPTIYTVKTHPYGKDFNSIIYIRIEQIIGLASWYNHKWKVFVKSGPGREGLELALKNAASRLGFSKEMNAFLRCGLSSPILRK